VLLGLLVWATPLNTNNIEIGERLHISSTTVETHRRNLMKKVGVSTAIGLMRWGLRHGLVDQI
jgi:DNA-binding NarL/FixJ family response regulator